MQVSLIHHTPLHVASKAIRTCWQSGEHSDTTEDMLGGWEDATECGPKDRELIERVGNKFKHSSTLEHLSYNFYIEGISRALLQELSRHRIASLSVKSSRYTLKELKKEEPFTFNDKYRLEKYIVLTGNARVDYASCVALEGLRWILAQGVSNDTAKYCMPESYKTTLTWTINARSLQNFLSLRTSKSALWEIQELAKAVFEALPEEHMYLFYGSVKLC